MDAKTGEIAWLNLQSLSLTAAAENLDLFERKL